MWGVFLISVSNGGAMAQPNSTVGNPLDDETTRFILGWAVLIAILVMVAKSRVGYATIYYGLTLLLFLLFVTQYQWITEVVTSATIEPPEEKPSTSQSPTGSGTVTLSTVIPLVSTSPYLSPGGIVQGF